LDDPKARAVVTRVPLALFLGFSDRRKPWLDVFAALQRPDDLLVPKEDDPAPVELPVGHTALADPNRGLGIAFLGVF
jgi:hypothetical protein